jgi:hypothetical protein
MPRLGPALLLLLLPVLAALAGGCTAPSVDADAGAGGEHDGAPGPPPEYVCGELPPGCASRLCITQVEHFGFEDCCDSTVCNCNPSTEAWETWYCDAPRPDAGVADATVEPDAENAPDAATSGSR